MSADIRKYPKTLAIFSIMAFGVMCGGVMSGVLGSENASSLTQKNYQRLDFTFEPTIQVSLSSSTLLVPDLVVNTYKDSNTIDVIAGTNVAAGMQLTATVGSANNLTSDLVQAGTANTFESIATNANLASLGESQSTNIWGYSYKNSNTETWGNYNGLPVYGNTGALLLETSEAASGTINFKIAAKAGDVQAMGNYTNSINFSAVAKVIATSYAINFLNGGNGVTNWPTNISSSDTTGQGATMVISSVAPVKSGYDFAGWCTVSTNDDSCTGNVYQPGDSYHIGAVGDTVTVNLYAMWGSVTFDRVYAAAGKTKYNGTNYYAMQDMTPDICGSVAIGQTTTLIDTRGTNKQTYTVAKLKDDKCWMTENLNIAGGTALSSNDTDFESTYTLPTTNGWSVSNGKLVLPSSSTAFGSTDNVAELYNSGNKTNCGGLNQNTPCYSYYSWDAATLGSGRSISTDNTDAPYSICPKNWKLPTSRTTSVTNWQTTSDFYMLAHQYGLNSTTSTSESDADFYNQAGPGTTPNFLLAGYYINSSFLNGGSNGVYWSSTSRSGADARYLNFYSSRVYSANSSYRRNGFSVRCLAAPSS